MSHNVYPISQHPVELELLVPLLSEEVADRCEAIAEDFIKGLTAGENHSLTSTDTITSGGHDLLGSIELSLIERGTTLAKLPRRDSCFTDQRLGLDILVCKEFRKRLDQGQDSPPLELLQLVLLRFQARARYWNEVAKLLQDEVE